MRVFILLICLLPVVVAFGQNEVIVEGAMKNVMWKGLLDAVVKTDTLHTGNLYAMGPIEHLRGEVMVWNDTVYISQVGPNGEMTVSIAPNVGMPFIAYSNVRQWKEVEVPKYLKDAESLERFLTSLAQPTDKPFLFKIEGQAKLATIHIVNLPEGSAVSSPAEAHRGLQKYQVKGEAFRALGFYSQNHQTIFTHHGTYIHVHLITADNKSMGHLEDIVFTGTIKLYVAE